MTESPSDGSEGLFSDLADYPDDAEDAENGKGNSQRDPIEEPAEAAAHSVKAAADPDKPQGLRQQIQPDSDAVGKKKIPLGLNRQTHMKNQNHDGAAQEKVGIVVDGQPRQKEQGQVHEQGGKMDAFHGTTSFRGYYTRSAGTKQAAMVKIHNY